MTTESKKEHKWSIYIAAKGIAKGCRKTERHTFDIALAHDDGTDESKPVLGGHDLQSLARATLEMQMRQVDSAEILAMPMVFSYDGMFHSKQFAMFDPRRFGAVVNDIDGKPYRKEKK